MELAKNEIRIGESVAPISVSRADFDITVIVDRCSIELFSDGGKIFMSCIDENTLSDRNIPYFMINSDKDIKLEKTKEPVKELKPLLSISTVAKWFVGTIALGFASLKMRFSL